MDFHSKSSEECADEREARLGLQSFLFPPTGDMAIVLNYDANLSERTRAARRMGMSVQRKRGTVCFRDPKTDLRIEA